MPQYFESRGKLYRKDGRAEERFDDSTGAWVNVRPAISDWLFNLDTEIDEIDEATARASFPAAFA